ncbi:uncharacterized protein LOC113290316 [Papaver somniferum]|uniref:uncharacterized protein LOC113290316 n=1 Tax=Papaver somniferum TaxID=3469 RepID=UPI000E6F6C53|nr:uncharacterized protein LOC113290316 [Papaver somniferum]
MNIEQLILVLVWATQKLRTYFLTQYIRGPCKAPLEAVLKSVGKVGRIDKWNTHLDQFNIIHEIQHSQKSQVLADFLAYLPLDNDEEVMGITEANEGKDPIDILEPLNQRRCEVFVDGSRNKGGVGIGIVITTPTRERIVHALRLEFKGHTNNIVKYEVVVHALRLIIEMEITDVRLTSDSQLVIRRIGLEYNVYDDTLSAYMALVQTLDSQIPSIKIPILCRKDLRHADALAYISSMLKDESVKAIKITRLYEPSITSHQSFATNREDGVREDIGDDNVGEYIVEDFIEDDIMTRENEDEDFSNEEDWRTEIHRFLEEGMLPTELKQARKIQSKEGRYDLRDELLYKNSFLGPLLRCLSREEGYRISKYIHYGDAGNHIGMRSLADKAKIQGYYWPQMIRDAARMSRRCEEFQRFGIPAEIVSDNGKQLHGKNIDMLLDTFKIRKNKSTPIYPQSNGQAEATNKTLGLILKNQLDEHKGRWCEQLHNVLWAYRTTRRAATGESPFLLTYGAEAVIPTEILMSTTKTEAWEKNLTTDMMLERLDDL